MYFHNLLLGADRFGFSNFIPHGHCYLWKPELVSLHLISDGLIALAYYSIPIVLFYFVRKRPDLPFHQVFLLFATFIIACGTTHLAEIWTLWYPTYWISGALKAFTATVSLFTAFELMTLIPQALALASPAQLEQANQALTAQVQERLRVEAELRQFQNDLEQRVQARTVELMQVNEQLQQEIGDRKRIEAEREQLLGREQTARAQAESANRIKDEFLAVLSHELRTPLTPILGWTQLLQSKTLTLQEQTYALNTIERNVQLQTQLISDLLDVSRILQGKLTLNRQTVNLAALIATAQDTVRLSAEAKAIQIQTCFASQMVLVLGDETRLQQVIWNLLSNAIKFTPSGGRIQIQLDATDKTAQIQVTDNGIGIDSAFLPEVFHYFRQADGTTTRRFGGLGLGLAIAHHLVELHGGTITAASQGQDQGATFTVCLPLLQQEPSHSKAALSPSGDPDIAYLLRGVRILIVDDETDTRNFVRFVLEQAGATTMAVAGATEAWEQLETFHPDLLLSDIGMPEVNGYELIQRIRATEFGSGLCAIALTAYAAEVDAQRAEAAGFQQHLAKPIEPKRLLDTITALLQPSSPLPSIPPSNPSD